MALKPIVEDLGEIPEQLREEYVETDNGYQLKVLQDFVPRENVEDVSGLKSALQKERENARASAKKVRELESQFGGIDLEELEELRQEKARAEEERAKKAGEWDKLKNQMVEKHTQEVAQLKEEMAKVRSAYEDQFVDAAVLAAIIEHKGIALLL